MDIGVGSFAGDWAISGVSEQLATAPSFNEWAFIRTSVAVTASTLDRCIDRTSCSGHSADGGAKRRRSVTRLSARPTRLPRSTASLGSCSYGASTATLSPRIDLCWSPPVYKRSPEPTLPEHTLDCPQCRIILHNTLFYWHRLSLFTLKKISFRW